MECNHKWEQLHEQFILGGHFPVGFRCVLCAKHVNQNQLTPAGLSGEMLGQHRLIGVHGSRIQRADGSVCQEQVITRDGKLHILESR